MAEEDIDNLVRQKGTALAEAIDAYHKVTNEKYEHSDPEDAFLTAWVVVTMYQQMSDPDNFSTGLLQSLDSNDMTTLGLLTNAYTKQSLRGLFDESDD